MNLQSWAVITKEALGKGFSVAKFFCALHVTNNYLCTLAMVHGPSMLPTFNITGSFVLADKISPRFGKVGAGDVVLIRSVEKPRLIITKRVVGMEGDTVTYRVDPKNSDRTETLVVPKGHIWIEGDNIYASNDSRKFGPVPYGLLHGRIFWKIWPSRDFGQVRRKAEGVDPI